MNCGTTLCLFHCLLAQQRPQTRSPTPMMAMTNSEVNSKDSSRPAPQASIAVPINSFFLHIKTAPCKPMCRRRFYACHFHCAKSVLYLCRRLMLPGFDFLGAFIQAHVAGVASRLDVPFMHCFQHRAARLTDMGAVAVSTMTQVWGKIREGLLQVFLDQEHHLLRIEGGKARRVDDAGAIGQAV